MKTKIIAIVLSTMFALASVMLSGCSKRPPPKLTLTAVQCVAVLDIVSVLPNLTTADKAWIAAAANGLSCSSTVLAKAEPAAQEAVRHRHLLRVVTGRSCPRISLTLRLPASQPLKYSSRCSSSGATPAAVAANAKVRKMSIGDREKIIATANIEGKVKIIRAEFLFDKTYPHHAGEAR